MQNFFEADDPQPKGQSQQRQIMQETPEIEPANEVENNQLPISEPSENNSEKSVDADEKDIKKQNKVLSSQNENLQKKIVEGGMQSINQISFMKVKETMIKHQMMLEQIKKREEHNFFCHGKKLNLAKTALFIFSDTNSFRKKIVWLVEWRWFDRFITFIILLNTFFLMFQDYEFRITGVVKQDTMSNLLDILELVFASIFFSEFLLKIIALGFLLEPKTYMREGWNIIDFFTVISSVISLTGSVNLSAIRTIRMLRPLRSINAIQGLRLLVSSLLDSLPDLANVVIFLLFLVVLFGILGLQLFIGVLENRCRYSPVALGDLWPADPLITTLCVENDDSTCPANLFCRNPGTHNVPQQYLELFIPQLNYGYTNFDNIFWAVFTIFQSLTTEGWTTIVYMVNYIDSILKLQNTANPYLVYIYFNLLIFMGSFFVVNLILAVINQSFLKINEKRKKEVEEEEKRIKEIIKQQKEEQKRQQLIAEGKLNPDDELVHQSDHLANLEIEFQSVQERRKHELQVIPIEDNKNNEEDEEESENKKREKLLFNLALRPVGYHGRAQLLKKLEEQHNRHSKKKLDFFDPGLITINKVDEEDEKNNPNTMTFQKKLNNARKVFSEKFLEGNLFTLIVTLFILANTVVLSLDRYPQPKSEKSALETANLVFTIFFTIEMILKLIGYGIKNYFRDQLNAFDCLIVIISLVEQIMNMLDQSVSNGSFTAISAFRSLRLFRIFKLARSWTTLRKLLMAIAATIGSILYFIILLFLFMIIASLLGMELFAYNIRFDQKGQKAVDKLHGISPRQNFDTFYNSMITIFALLTSEGWNNLTYQFMIGMDAWWPLIFFVVIVIIGNFILLKLFIAILLYNFGESSIEAQKKIDEQNKRAGFAQLFEDIKKGFQKKQVEKQEKENQYKKTAKVVPEYTGHNPNSDAACFFQAKYDPERFEERKERKARKIVRRFFETADVMDYEDVSDDSEEEKKEKESQKKEYEMKRLEEKLRNTEQRQRKHSLFDEQTKVSTRASTVDVVLEMENMILSGRSLYIFDSKNKLRRVIYQIITKPAFEYFIILMILISSILLALDDPVKNEDNSIVSIIDTVITIIFVVEAFMKIIAMGFIINGEYSYFRQLSNVLDFSVIIFSILSSFQNSSSGMDFSTLKILRVLRVLRPLRLISRNEGLKIAINALILSIPSIFNLVIVCTIFFLLFGIFGVNQFKGQFYYCDYTQIPLKFQLLIETNNDCFDYGGSWINNDFNFDNILQAMVQLFVISTTEGWIDLMNYGSDSRGINLEPKLNSRQYWQLFYVGFVVVGSFFIINLFVGIVVDAFNIEKDKLHGYFYLTAEQQEWVDIQYRIYESKAQIKPMIPKEGCRRYIYLFMMNSKFEKFLMILIILNTVLFMVQFNRQPNEMSDIIFYGNLTFLGIFFLESIFKIIALGRIFFLEPFNNFDLFVVLISAIGVALEQGQIFKSIGTATSVLRLFRIVRVLRLIRSAGSLRTMFTTFIVSLPALANIGGLLAIVLFIFSVLGMNLYPYLKRTETGISNDVNFSSFLASFFTLFKCATGEQWNLVLGDSVRKLKANYVCFEMSSYEDYLIYGFNGCGNWSGYLFFVLFEITFSMIMLNLFVAVIIQGFDRSSKDEYQKIRSSEIEQFQEIWKQFDKFGTGFIPATQFTQFMMLLSAPLGWQKSLIDGVEQRMKTMDFEIPAYIIKKNKQGMYFYYDVLRVLSYTYLKKEYGEMIDLEPDKPVKAHKDLIKIREKKMDSIMGVQFSKFTSRDIVACQILKSKLKKLVELRKQTEKEEAELVLKRQKIEEEEQQDNENEQKQQINYEIDALLNLEGASPLRQKSTLGFSRTSKFQRYQNNEVSFIESDTEDNIKNR